MVKQYVVLGLGDFGINLALSLANLGQQVLVIDKNRDKIEAIKDKVTQAVIGDVKNKEMLLEFVKPDIDSAIISIGNIEASVLVTLYLHEIGIKHIAVKPVNEDHGAVLKAVGANELIYPDKDMAEKMAMRLTKLNLVEQIALSPGYSIIEMAVPDIFVGKSLSKLKLRNTHGVEVIAVKEPMSITDSFVVAPPSDYILPVDSVLVILGKDEDLRKLKEL